MWHLTCHSWYFSSSFPFCLFLFVLVSVLLFAHIERLSPVWGIFSRPGKSQGLLYKHLCSSKSLLHGSWSVIISSLEPLHSFIHAFIKSTFSLPHIYVVAMPKRLEIGLQVIKYTISRIKTFLNPKGHQNPIGGSKVIAILMKGCILPIGGVASGRVCGSVPAACAAGLFLLSFD